MKNLIAGVFAFLSLTTAAYALECEPGYVTVWCRGPLNIEFQQKPGCVNPTECLNSPYSQIHFNKNATGAGQGGEKLRLGSCAWPARPFYVTENGPISTVWSNYPLSTQTFEIMNSCIVDGKCAFAMCAKHNPERNRFDAFYQNGIVRVYPAYP